MCSLTIFSGSNPVVSKKSEEKRPLTLGERCQKWVIRTRSRARVENIGGLRLQHGLRHALTGNGLSAGRTPASRQREEKKVLPGCPAHGLSPRTETFASAPRRRPPPNLTQPMGLNRIQRESGIATPHSAHPSLTAPPQLSTSAAQLSMPARPNLGRLFIPGGNKFA